MTRRVGDPPANAFRRGGWPACAGVLAIACGTPGTVAAPDTPAPASAREETAWPLPEPVRNPLEEALAPLAEGDAAEALARLERLDAPYAEDAASFRATISFARGDLTAAQAALSEVGDTLGPPRVEPFSHADPIQSVRWIGDRLLVSTPPWTELWDVSLRAPRTRWSRPTAPLLDAIPSKTGPGVAVYKVGPVVSWRDVRSGAQLSTSSVCADRGPWAASDGWIAVACKNGTVEMRRQSGEPVEFRAGPAEIAALHMDHGLTVAARAYVLDPQWPDPPKEPVETGTILTVFDVDRLETQPPIELPDVRDVSALALSPDGEVVAVATAGALRFIDLETRLEHAAWATETHGTSPVLQWSPEGRFLYQGGAPGLRVWDREEPEAGLRTLRPSAVAQGEVAVSDDGRLAVVGEHGVEIWRDGHQVTTFAQHRVLPVIAAGWSRDGGRVSMFSRGGVHVLDLRERSITRAEGFQGDAAVFGPDGETMFSNRAELWKGGQSGPTSVEATPAKADDPIEHLFFTRDGRRVGGTRAMTLHLWDARDGRLRVMAPIPTPADFPPPRGDDDAVRTVTIDRVFHDADRDVVEVFLSGYDEVPGQSAPGVRRGLGSRIAELRVGEDGEPRWTVVPMDYGRTRAKKHAGLVSPTGAVELWSGGRVLSVAPLAGGGWFAFDRRGRWQSAGPTPVAATVVRGERRQPLVGRTDHGDPDLLADFVSPKP